jgi:hypothetical protein
MDASAGRLARRSGKDDLEKRRNITLMVPTGS